jgi:type VI secretion system protein ImpL
MNAFSGQTVRSMAERLKELTPADFEPGWHQDRQKTDPSLLMFPEEFEKLEPGLNAFMRGAFQENPYQETPS